MVNAVKKTVRKKATRANGKVMAKAGTINLTVKQAQMLQSKLFKAGVNVPKFLVNKLTNI